MTADVFGTAALRAAVLEAWRASPARLREDANTEEDHARGYYRDRVVVELAQNAADAAARAGVPGRLLLRLTTGPTGVAELVAANTGAPLDAVGVASLASMRASAKRDAAPSTVGRFGVGFAAVRAVADDVTVASTTGAVRFSLDATRAALADTAAREASHGRPELAAEADRREGSLPALRLPWESDARPPAGYDTAVVLTLRDAAAADAVRALLAEVGDALLLALPGLVEVVVEDDDAPPRRLAAVTDRWHVRTVEGELPLALTADRPVEERSARRWRVTWAVPRDGAGVRPPGVVHAPTPTDEPLGLPALLVATLPLDPSRRHVVAGPLTDAVLDHAADAYAALLGDLAAAGRDVLDLVPTGLPDGPLDAALRERAVAALTRTPVLTPATPAAVTADPVTADPVTADPVTPDPTTPDPAAADERPTAPRTPRVAPRDATLVRDLTDPAAVRALGTVLAGLVDVPPAGRAAARALGVEERTLAEVVDDLPAGDGVDWPALYDALEPAAADPRTRESLGALPVPLADGRTVRGARGTAVLDGDLADALAPDTLAVLRAGGLRVVDPRAARPLLVRLGADQPDAAALLAHPAVRAAVLAQADDDDLDHARRVTDAVLDLVAALPAVRDAAASHDVHTHAAPAHDAPAHVAPSHDLVPPDAAPWLGLLTLHAADGEPSPAHGLVLPGSPAAALLDDRVLAPVALDAVDRWGPAVLTAVGVRADLVVTRVPDVVTGVLADDDPDDPAALAAASLDGWTEYVDHLADAVGAGLYVGDVDAVADLDAVAEDAWPDVLVHVASRPHLRAALLTPARAEGAGTPLPSYAAWWLRTRVEPSLPAVFALAGSDAPAGLLPPVPRAYAHLDPDVLRALGGVGSLAELGPADWDEVLDRLGPPGTRVPPAVAAAVWRAWAADDVPGALAPDVVVALTGDPDAGPAVVAEASSAVVADGPSWWQRRDLGAVVPVPPGTNAPRVAERLDVPRAAESADGRVDEPGDVEPVPDAVADLLTGVPAVWERHDDLTVDGEPVEWWVEGAGADARVHAVHLAGLAAGLAAAAGAWHLRAALEALLVEPGRPDAVLDVLLG
ncbi:sacsin N-terminal ATP-binding-like domain-containing protein [Cellulomonas sp. 179-A 9B4 NHS]|uniref:sacsin N-terminal ATP-binding-like domain-containing protein n=1 Tax=Cellulomonas sp. 179-A 9B4 NHS TaxID=3142379 RepID=UPI0039A313C0